MNTIPEGRQESKSSIRFAQCVDVVLNILTPSIQRGVNFSHKNSYKSMTCFPLLFILKILLDFCGFNSSFSKWGGLCWSPVGFWRSPCYLLLLLYISLSWLFALWQIKDIDHDDDDDDDDFTQQRSDRHTSRQYNLLGQYTLVMVPLIHLISRVYRMHQLVYKCAKTTK